MPTSKEQKGSQAEGRTARAADSARSGRESGGGEEPLDAIALLEQQHRAVESLFDEIARFDDRRAARGLILELADLLIGHSVIEERHFYPAVRTPETEELVADSYHDHQDMKKLLLHILEAGEGDEDFGEKLEELEGQVESHVDEEEEVLFARARQLLDEDQLMGLAQEMTATLTEERQNGDPRERLSHELHAAGIV